MSPGEGRVSNLALKTELEGLGGDIKEIKTLLEKLEERLRCLEKSDAGSHPVMLNRIETLETKVTQHDRDLKALQQMITDQKDSINNLKNSLDSVKTILKWLLAIFTAVAITVISLLVTGQALMVFK